MRKKDLGIREDLKWCSNCEFFKLREFFYKNKRKKDGLGDQCKDCMNEYGYKYRRAQKQKKIQEILNKE